MKSKLEKFIQQNAKELNTETPNASVWETIEKNMLPVKKHKAFSLKVIYKYSAAAAIFFVVIISAYFLFVKNKQIETPSASEIAKTNSKFQDYKIEDSILDEKKLNGNKIENLMPEYANEAKQHYKTIEVKQAKLKSATKDDPNLYKQFTADLKILDSTYKMLEIQAETSPNRDVIIKAMLQNLALKAELLARQLAITNEFKNNKNKENEKNNTRNM